ncbi:DUF2951 family protein, partial [Staphylococcus sp. EG-SA-1]|uniref:DUF2951 family protein n=1 Tax=Staphylococcus sp. EG-SA-1 TaxID=2767484 RepID=UPI001F11DA20
NSLSSYARVNEFGFIETPYRKVDLDTHAITDQIDYLTADEEDEKNKEKNAKNIRDIKMWILGLIGTILSTFVIALLKTIFG